jgi:hypothetical protein
MAMALVHPAHAVDRDVLDEQLVLDQFAIVFHERLFWLPRRGGGRRCSGHC